MTIITATPSPGAFWPGREGAHHAPLVLLCAAAGEPRSWSIASSRGAWTSCPDQSSVFKLAGAGRRAGGDAPRRNHAGHAVLAQQRHHVCFHGGRRTVEFLRTLGKRIVSSADLVSQFEAVLSEEQWPRME